ncbi:MAG: phosphoenolpyruvate synthase [Hyphomicrobiales bacterium]|nr:phosphoenolpyruvate synthase [Hyphomicrobiales bacterium]
MHDIIRFFTSLSASSISEVGGKGANLGELTKAGFGVPAGFCITTAAYSDFIQPKQKQVSELLENLDAQNLVELRNVGEKVRQLLGSLPLPENFEKPIITAWRKIGENKSYAVRSSATAEDLPQASFAGQQDTYLNIMGRHELLKSVKNCFISLFTDRAILYRVQNNFDHEDVRLAVVIQEMILPEASGIMFTADPVSGKRSIVSIDASFGIGEALVSGLVSADLYQVDKSNFEISKKQIGDKKLAILPSEGGGTKTVNLSPEESGKCTLDDVDIIKLAKLATAIEKHYGKPQDIEWAFVNGEFFITQSRPITSLYPVPRQENAPQKIYVSLNHLQVMTDAMSPLSISLFISLLPIGRDEKTLQNRYVMPAGGRMFAEISNILSHPIAGRIFPKLLDRADHLAGKMVARWQEDNLKSLQKSKISLLKIVPVLAPLIRRVLACLWWRKYDEYPLEIANYMNGHLDQIRARAGAVDDPGEKLNICCKAIGDTIHTIEPWRAHLIASMLAIKLLSILMKDRVASSELDALMRGLKGNVTTQMDLAVGDLADYGRASEGLTKCLLNPETDFNTKLKLAHAQIGGKQFIQQWNRFIVIYGARGPSEIDLHRPRWREDGSSLMTMVAGILKSGVSGAHRDHYRQLVEQNAAACEQIVKSAGSGIFGFLRRRVVRRLLYVIGELFPLREHHKFLIIRLLDIAKPVILNAGAKLQSENKIDDAGDVWFMTSYELRELLNNNTTISTKLVQQRRQDLEICQKLTPPRVMVGDGEILSASFDSANTPAGSLVGSPVSAGIVEGIAKVIIDPATDILHPGEILVAPHTDPGWTPLFVNAAGLVAEVGGLMTHGSVIAREYGIPAVVSVVDATTKIRTGQKIRVHGEAGYVEFLDEDER